MKVLMIGLALAVAFFVALHLVVAGTSLRAALVQLIGEGRYLTLFSVASAGGLVGLIFAYRAGFASSDNQLLYSFGPGAAHVAAPLMLIAVVFARARHGANYERYLAVTSNLPFWAIITGKTQLRLSEIGWARVLLAVAVYLGFVLLHPYAFGVSPLPRRARALVREHRHGRGGLRLDRRIVLASYLEHRGLADKQHGFTRGHSRARRADCECGRS